MDGTVGWFKGHADWIEGWPRFEVIRVVDDRCRLLRWLLPAWSRLVGMRLALLSDIHGNPIALDAVLADVEAQGGVDGYVVLGDLAAIGHDPVTVLERVTAPHDAWITRGNTDRYLVTGDRPPIPPPPGKEIEVAHSFAWTQGYVTGAGWFNWLG